MAENVLSIWGEIIGIAIGGTILLIFGATFSHWFRRPQVLPGSSGTRTSQRQQAAHDVAGQEEGGEVVRADGFVEQLR